MKKLIIQKVCCIYPKNEYRREGNTFIKNKCHCICNSQIIEEFEDSLYIESGSKVKRSCLVAAFGKYFEKYYELFLESGNLSPIKDEYEERLVNKDREVYIIEKDNKIIRTAIGIDDEGQLVVKDDAGRIEKIFAGEVSVRGIYGYV